MTFAALLLVLLAAFMHASWNLLAKRASGGALFVWWCAALAGLLYAPVAAAVVLVGRPHLGPVQLVFMAGSALLHLTYFTLLQAGYRFGDLSLVYPLARGTGPMLATLLAIVLLGERPGPIALAGVALVVASVFLLTGGTVPKRGDLARRAIAFGLATGGLIAVYTLWDAHAVGALGIPPVLQDWGADAGRALALTPYALGRRGEAAAIWRKHGRKAIGVAVLSPLAYILVLSALSFTAVSRVAPAREVSILIATFMGTRFLSERQVRRRLLAAAGMVVGIAAIAVG